MTNVTPNLRVGVLAWSREAAHGPERGLAWVDTTLRDDGRPFLPVGEGTDGGPAFRHVPYGLFLPPPLLEAAQQAAARGEPTALQGLLLGFARVEWLVASRHLWWTPLSPVPRLLTSLVEAFGIDPTLHRADPARLTRLLAHLPRFHPHRGSAQAAVDLVRSALGEELGVVVRAAAAPGEVFACRSAAWWRRRGGAPADLVITAGIVRCTTTGAAPAGDVLLARRPDADLPLALLRLLPVWASARLQPEQDA